MFRDTSMLDFVGMPETAAEWSMYRHQQPLLYFKDQATSDRAHWEEMAAENAALLSRLNASEQRIIALQVQAVP